MSIKEQLVEALLAESRHSTSIFGGITNDDYWYYAGGCHGDMTSGFTYTEVVITRLQMQSDTEDQYKFPYLHWLLNKSPYASAFITKDEDIACRDGYVECTGHTPSNLLLGAIQCTRRLWEDTYVPIVWNKLVNLGFNKNLAFFLCCSLRNYGGYPPVYSMRGYITDHNPLFTCKMLKESIINFIQGKLVNPLDDFYNNTDYRQVVQAWGLNVTKREAFFTNYIEGIMPLPCEKIEDDWQEERTTIKCGTFDQIIEQITPLKDTLHEEFKCAE